MIIDRFEGDFAVVETDIGMTNISRELLPENAKEGDVIGVTDGVYYIDEEETQSRRKSMLKRFRKLRGDADD